MYQNKRLRCATDVWRDVRRFKSGVELLRHCSKIDWVNTQEKREERGMWGNSLALDKFSNGILSLVPENALVQYRMKVH